MLAKVSGVTGVSSTKGKEIHMNGLIIFAIVCWGVVVFAAVCAILDHIPAVHKLISKIIRSLPLMW